MTNPKLRFRSADGSLFEDWKSVKVGDIAETCGGGTPQREMLPTGEALSNG